jgi:hypothetical protein
MASFMAVKKFRLSYRGIFQSPEKKLSTIQFPVAWSSSLSPHIKRPGESAEDRQINTVRILYRTSVTPTRRAIFT